MSVVVILIVGTGLAYMAQSVVYSLLLSKLIWRRWAAGFPFSWRFSNRVSRFGLAAGRLAGIPAICTQIWSILVLLLGGLRQTQKKVNASPSLYFRIRGLRRVIIGFLPTPSDLEMLPRENSRHLMMIAHQPRPLIDAIFAGPHSLFFFCCWYYCGQLPNMRSAWMKGRAGQLGESTKCSLAPLECHTFPI